MGRSRRGLRWALEGIVCQHLTVARVAEGRGVAWNIAADTVLAEERRVLKRELVTCLRTARALREPSARSRDKPQGHVTTEVVLSERPRRGRRPAPSLAITEGDLIIGTGRSAIGTLVEHRGSARRTRTLVYCGSHFPKGTDLSRWSAEDLEAVAYALNNRPRKTDWKPAAIAALPFRAVLRHPGAPGSP